MGIDRHHAVVLIREHAYKPLPETVHLIGRQTVRLTQEQVEQLCREAGVAPVSVPITIDRETRLSQADPSKEYISDNTFFGMLGVKNLVIIDHSDYEGASVIIDLNCNIPDEYRGSAEFVFGGSVCDNVFDPAMYIRNMAELLKPGGRLVDQNIVTDHYHPYAILPPAWYFDYFNINRFSDCKLYILECTPPAVYAYFVDVTENTRKISNFTSRDTETANGIFLIAEKGKGSTSTVSPIQDQYRTAQQWATYRNYLEEIRKSPRPVFEFIMECDNDSSEYPPRQIPGYRFVGKLW